MAIWSERHNLPAKRSVIWGHARQQLLLIPEAIILLALLLIGWATHFPPLLGALALLIACLFGIRLSLIAVAARKLANGAYETADRLLAVALKLHPWSLDALLLRAQGLTQRGDDEAAEAVLRRAAHYYPDDESLQSILASSMLAQGRLTDGWRILYDTRQGAVERLTPAVAQQRAWIALHVEADAAKARAIILRAAPDRLPPRLALPLQVTLAEALLSLGAHGESLRLMEQIEANLALCPPSQQAELLYHLGRLYVAHGRSGTAYFRRSVQRDPRGRFAQSAWRSAVEG